MTRWWLDGNPWATAIFNSLSVSFPRGEAFFIDSVRAFRDGASDELAENIRAFIAQEVNHSREHLVFNRAVGDAGYDVDALDRDVEDALAVTRGRPAIVNLAATIALEHFTAMFAHQILKNPAVLKGADPEQAALWRWHAVEEIEHKAVAYDTFLHATRDFSAWKRWKLRAIMMLVASQRFIHFRYRGALLLLAQDGITGWRAHAGLLRELLLRPGIGRKILPHWLGYFRPGFHPWKLDDRYLVKNERADATD